MASSWEPMLIEIATTRGARLRAYAAMLAGPSGADDLVQDALIATFSRRRSFTNAAQAEQYVRRAIATRYIDSVRRDASRKARDTRTARADRIEDPADAIASHDAVGAVLAGLPPRPRACLVLRYIEDLSVRETAHVLGLSEGTVKRYVSDGLAALNAQLGTSEDLADLETAGVSPRKGGA
jgi:RNA polymerase sigma factor (sigma-70 family)